MKDFYKGLQNIEFSQVLKEMIEEKNMSESIWLPCTQRKLDEIRKEAKKELFKMCDETKDLKNREFQIKNQSEVCRGFSIGRNPEWLGETRKFVKKDEKSFQELEVKTT
jgi:hypothetical protein